MPRRRSGEISFRSHHFLPVPCANAPQKKCTHNEFLRRAAAGGTKPRRPRYANEGSPNKEDFMTTSSGHTTAILASRVKGTSVYNGQGDKIGTVEDVVLDKQSNRIMFAALG